MLVQSSVFYPFLSSQHPHSFLLSFFLSSRSSDFPSPCKFYHDFLILHLLGICLSFQNRLQICREMLQLEKISFLLWSILFLICCCCKKFPLGISLLPIALPFFFIFAINLPDINLSWSPFPLMHSFSSFFLSFFFFLT